MKILNTATHSDGVIVTPAKVVLICGLNYVYSEVEPVSKGDMCTNGERIFQAANDYPTTEYHRKILAMPSQHSLPFGWEGELVCSDKSNFVNAGTIWETDVWLKKYSLHVQYGKVVPYVRKPEPEQWSDIANRFLEETHDKPTAVFTHWLETNYHPPVHI